MSTHARRRGLLVGVLTTTLAGTSLVLGTTAASGDPISESQGLRKALTLAGVREHQQAFQTFSDANGGNRVASSPGYEASADYVEQRLEAAGYTVTRDPFEFLFNADLTPPVLSQVSPRSVDYVDGVDFASMTFSPNGDVTAPLTAVDLVVPPVGPGNGNTSGCEAADFAGFPAGSVALVQRGTCTFADKAANAAAAGAAAVVVFNEGQPGRQAALSGTLGGPVAHTAPVVGTSFAVGDELRNGVLNGPTGTTVRVRVDRVNEVRTTENVIAETTGDADHVVVVGAHLDSVSRGPGVNDNGSGSAGILEIAEQFAARGIAPRNRVRVVWFGAEEFGLLGSRAYVAELSQAERDRIELNLNFDMIGSPNFVRFVYDGDNSAFPVGPGAADGPTGSGEIERVFHSYFASQGLASSETPFSGRSDYGPFIEAGIPAGGLFTGAEGVKTEAQAAVYGGTAGEQYDPCYHLACDTFANNSDAGLHQMSDAAAHTTLYFAKRNYVKNPLVDPAGPVGGTAGDGGGGGLHAHEDEAVAR